MRPLQNQEEKAVDADVRPLSKRKGTRASEARSQGYAGVDAGPRGLILLKNRRN